MKWICCLFTLALLTMFFTSCQQEVDDDLPGSPTGSQNDSILLSKYVELDTTYPSGSDTLIKFLFTYDSRKRLTKAVYIYYPLATGLPATDSQIDQFFYNGTDTLPFKAVYDVDDLVNYSDDTTFYSYSNGLLSRDSSISHVRTGATGTIKTIKTYTPSGNNTILNARNYYSGGIGPYSDEWTGTIFKTYANGNIISQRDTSTFGILYTAGHQVDIVYDNKPNPFYRVSIPYPVYTQISAQKNNILNSVITLWGGTPDNYFYNYEYRDDGYPLVVRYYYVVTPGDVTKGIYFYTK